MINEHYGKKNDLYIYICLVERKLEGKQGMTKVGRKRKFLYLFGEKWNEGKEIEKRENLY